MSVAGKWKVIIKGPTGPEHTILELQDVGSGKLTGAQTGKGATTEITDGRLDGKNISWVNKVTKPMKIKVKFNGLVDGDSISGKAKPGLLPACKFTATRDDN